MGKRAEFEIKHEERGFFVFSTTSWWSRDDLVASAGGLTCSLPFATPKEAMAWVKEQFAVPTKKWRRRNATTLVARIGDDLPRRSRASAAKRPAKGSPTAEKALPPKSRPKTKG